MRLLFVPFFFLYRNKRDLHELQLTDTVWYESTTLPLFGLAWSFVELCKYDFGDRNDGEWVMMIDGRRWWCDCESSAEHNTMLFGFPMVPRINAAEYPWSDRALLMMFVLQRRFGGCSRDVWGCSLAAGELWLVFVYRGIREIFFDIKKHHRSYVPS